MTQDPIGALHPVAIKVYEELNALHAKQIDVNDIKNYKANVGRMRSAKSIVCDLECYVWQSIDKYFTSVVEGVKLLNDNK